jgi:hypothetical protein
VDLNYGYQARRALPVGKITGGTENGFLQGLLLSQINPSSLQTLTGDAKEHREDQEGFIKKKGYLGARVRLSDLGKDEEGEDGESRHRDPRGSARGRDLPRQSQDQRAQLEESHADVTDGGSSRYEIDASVKAIPKPTIARVSRK